MMAFVRGSTGQTAFGKMIDEGDCDPGRLEKKSFCIEGAASGAPSQCFSFHVLIGVSCMRRNGDAVADFWTYGNAALDTGLWLRRSGRIYGTRRPWRPGAFHRADDRRRCGLLRHRGTVRQW